MSVEQPSPTPRRVLTPTAAARKLGCSRCRVYALVREGKLEAMRSERGRFLRLDADSIAIFGATYRVRHRSPRGSQIATRVSGSLAQAVFLAFDAGKDLAEIVTELAVAPNVVRALWKQHRTSLQAGETEVRERELRQEKERRDREQSRAEHRREIAQIQAKATIQAAERAARIAARAPRSA